MQSGLNSYTLPEHLWGAQALTAMYSSEEHRFLIASCNENVTTNGNEIHQVAFNEDTNSIQVEDIYKLAKSSECSSYAIYDIVASPYKPSQVACQVGCELQILSLKSKNQAQNGDASTEDQQQMWNTRSSELKGSTLLNQRIDLGAMSKCSFCWEDAEEMPGKEGKFLLVGSQDQITIKESRTSNGISLEDGGLLKWDLETGKTSVLLNDSPVQVCRVDPHYGNGSLVSAVGSNENVMVLDERVDKQQSVQFKAHGDNVLDLSFNPNQLHTMATAGADGVTRIWDLRKTQSSLVNIEDQQNLHWASHVKYNPLHDSLILIGASNTYVSLIRQQNSLSANSGANGGNLQMSGMANDSLVLESSFTASNYNADQSATGSQLPQYSNNSRKSADSNSTRVVQRYELEDSVAAVQWSQKTPWVFASLAYNGTLVVNTVPSVEKYRILL